MSVFNDSDVIDGLRIQNLIKSNLYTETYRVVDIDDNPFFLKVFIPGKMPFKLKNPETGIVREIEYSQDISHSNIVSCTMTGNVVRGECDYQYYVTNYISGRILSDYIATKGVFSESDALPVFEKLLKGE